MLIPHVAANPATLAAFETAYANRRWLRSQLAPGDYPSDDRKHVGDVVQHCHPCGHTDEIGVVIAVELGYPGGPAADVVSMYGRTHGAAANWKTIHSAADRAEVAA